MNANQFMQHLISLGACNEAKDWALGKSWQEIYDTCHRGDWLLWLYRRSKGYDFQKLTLAKGFCANTVRHLMKDERSLKAVDAAIAFGRGEISIEDLNAVAADAYTAYAAAAGAAAAGAAYAAAAGAAAAGAAYAAYTASAAVAAVAAGAASAAVAAVAAGAASAAAAANAAAYAAADTTDAAYVDAARKENQQKTADIVREVLPFEIWEL